MSSVAEAIFDTCARSESTYGIVITGIRISHHDYDKLRTEREYARYFDLRENAVRFNGVVVEVGDA